MNQPNIPQMIEQLITSQTQAAPNLISGYESALGNAAQLDQQSIDQLRGIYSDPSKFQKSALGAFGLGLMAPTKSGNFGEGMYNAFSGAMQAADYNREQNLSREEKLAKLGSLQAALARQQANDSTNIFDKKTAMVGALQGNEKIMADLNLRGAQYGPRQLAPNEEGPPAPGSDYISQSEALMADYYANPNKYIGAQGQAMVANAQSILNNHQTNQRMRDIAQSRANKPYSPDAGSRKQIREIELGQLYLDDSLRHLDRAFELSGEGMSNSGFGASWRAGVAENLPDALVPDAIFGSKQQGRNTKELAQIMDLEAIKGVGAYLKGPTSDRDVRLMLETLSDTDASWERKQAAVDRVRTRVKLEMIFNKELQRQLQTGDAYEDGGGIPQYLRDWTEEQIMGGADPNKVMEVLQKRLAVE